MIKEARNRRDPASVAGTFQSRHSHGKPMPGLESPGYRWLRLPCTLFSCKKVRCVLAVGALSCLLIERRIKAAARAQRAEQRTQAAAG